MTVIEYKVGEHPQGLIGYRVARTLGSDNLRKEFFFSRSVYGETAEQLARKKDLELLKLADKNRKENALKRKSDYQFATGFCAKILVERKIRGGELRTYFCPVFYVTTGRGDKAFRIPKWGYQRAWNRAVKYYVAQNAMNNPAASSGVSGGTARKKKAAYLHEVADTLVSAS